MRSTLGIAVFSGMLGVTIFGVFFTPVFYYVIRWFTARSAPVTPASTPGDHHPPASAPHNGDGRPPSTTPVSTTP
jgi:hypothetical protein